MHHHLRLWRRWKSGARFRDILLGFRMQFRVKCVMIGIPHTDRMRVWNDFCRTNNSIRKDVVDLDRRVALPESVKTARNICGRVFHAHTFRLLQIKFSSHVPDSSPSQSRCVLMNRIAFVSPVEEIEWHHPIHFFVSPIPSAKMIVTSPYII